MKNITETISRYIGAWNEKTPGSIKSTFQECCAPGATYTDKNMPPLHGLDALTDLVVSSHTKFPGITFSILTRPEYFDNQCYYSWGFIIPGQEERAGRDFIEYNDEGLITRIVGFLPV